MNNIYNTPLKHCPFCGSIARRTGGTVGNVTITSCRCSNNDCIASFKSVEYEVWNIRAKKRVANATTTSQWKDGPYESGFMMEINMTDKINTKDMVDVITAVLDHYELLDGMPEDELQCLCEDLKDVLDDFIGEEE